MKVKWSKRALASFEEYIDFISFDKPLSAEKWALKVIEKVDMLIDFPEIGKIKLGKSKSGIRELIIDKDYIAAYSIHKDGCKIMSFRRVSQTNTK